MNDWNVRTIRERIFLQFATAMARAAFSLKDGAAAREQRAALVRQTFSDLHGGRKNWLDIIVAHPAPPQAPRACVFCGAAQGLAWGPIVPKAIRINHRCPTCEIVYGARNRMWSCAACAARKAGKGLYTFWRELHPDDPAWADCLPDPLERDYLRILYPCCSCAGVLDFGDLDGDGVVTPLDLDAAINVGLPNNH